MTTAPNLDLARVTPDSFAALHRLAADTGARAQDAGLAPGLVELVRLRASQLNGCGYCQALHTRQAAELGEDEQRLADLARWPQSAAFTDAERAALRLTEALTRVDGRGVDDEIRAAAEHFGEAELAGLLWTIALIGVYNRLAIGSGLTG
ncbi:carboxymuconolactone decarboxylase family protein [Saccharopolyspora sp. CA-218241]|uniref:carboxymuconolactone decarboxylase family protein n=1 Tax=Saccharopolyspora sp. CA-218241 TaxID=3240027 RepID=UPI003D958942